jgi:hypothetical protein
MVGSSAILNGEGSTSASMVQGETDTCYRMPGDIFRKDQPMHSTT